MCTCRGDKVYRRDPVHILPAGHDPMWKILKAFRLIICRKPKDKEEEMLLSYFNDVKKEMQQTPAKAENFLKAGEYKHETITDKPSAAALMQVIHTIYNMEEAITKS